jgi:hypothetical protein
MLVILAHWPWPDGQVPCPGKRGKGQRGRRKHTHRRVLVQRKHQWLLSSHKRGGSTKHPTGGDGRRQIPRGRTTPISSWRRRLVIPLGGVGRGRRGACFAQGGSGRVHRSWPERLGGGGDPVARGKRGEEEVCE